MKIALLASFPTYQYRNKIKFRNPRPDLVSSWNVNLAKALARIPGHEVHVLTNASLWRTITVEDEGVIIHFVGHPPRLDLLDFITNLQFSKVHFHYLLKNIKPDVVHGSGTDHEYGYIAVTSGYPSVVTVHGVMGQIVKKTQCLPAIYRTFAMFERKVVAKANHVIAISDYVVEQFRDIITGEVHRIENAVNPLFFDMPTCEEYDIVFVGIWDENKRLLNLLKAVKQLKCLYPNIHLKIIGNPRGDKAYAAKVKSFIKEDFLHDNVDFLNQLSQEEVAKTVAKARLLVLPSIEENLPMAIAEALSLGKPVVATNIGGVKDMVKDGENGLLIPPDDIGALVRAINTILSDKDLRMKMSRQAKEDARMMFCPDIVARKTTEVYYKSQKMCKS